MEVKI